MAITLYDEQGRAYPTEVIRVRGADVRLLADNTVTFESRTAQGDTAPSALGSSRGVFPIQDYNATLDGATDDTDAWNRAVTAAWLAGGGVVQWLESGTSVVNKVKLRDNVTLRLGDQSTLLLNPNAVAGDFVVGNDDFVNGNVGVSVEGGRYDGNSAAFGIGPNITTMQFQRTPGLAVRDCYVTGGVAEGVYVFDSTNVDISGVTADHCGKVVPGDADGSGIHLNECARVRLSGVSTTYCGFHGLFVNGCQEVTGDVYAAHNNIDNIRVNAGYAVNLTVNCVESVMRGLYLNLGCYGCSFAGAVVGSGWHGVVMNESYACQFTGVSVDSGAGFHDAYFLLDSDELSFHGRARKTVNEGPASNVFVTGPYVLSTDARLNNARTPTAHAASHAAAGSDPVTPAAIGAASAAALTAHSGATASVHGITDTAQLAVRNAANTFTGANIFRRTGAIATFDTGAATDARVEFHYNGVRGGGFSISGTQVNLFTDSGKSILLQAASGSGSIRLQCAQLGFFAATPVSRPAAYNQVYTTASRTVPAYTPDPESATYTGAADGEAKLADLNALRAAYENLRVDHEALKQNLTQILDDLQSLGLLQ